MKLARGQGDSLSSLVVKGTGLLLGGRIARTLVTIIGTGVIARLITPEDFGVVAVASMLLVLGRALLEGLIDVPTIREDDIDEDGLANLIWSGLLLTAVLYAAIYMLAPLLEHLLNADRYTKVVRVIALSLFFQPLTVAGNALLRRQHRFAVVGVHLFLGGVSYVSVAGTLAYLGFGVWSLVYGQLTSVALVMIGLVFTSGTPLHPPLRLHPQSAWQSGGKPLQARILIWSTANVDTLLASAVLGPHGAGIYSRAYNIVTQFKEPFGALDQAVRQAFIADKELPTPSQDEPSWIFSGLRLIFTVSAIMAGLVIAMREPIVMILLGDQWTDAVQPLAILAASFPARIARMYLDSFSYAKGSITHLVKRNLILLVVMTTGLVVFAHHGVAAIACVVAFGHIVSLIFTGGDVDRAYMGSLPQRLLATIPGVLVGVLLVSLGEAVSGLAGLQNTLLDWTLRAAYLVLFIGVTGSMIPDSWLTPSIARKRQLVVTGAMTHVKSVLPWHTTNKKGGARK